MGELGKGIRDSPGGRVPGDWECTMGRSAGARSTPAATQPLPLKRASRPALGSSQPPYLPDGHTGPHSIQGYKPLQERDLSRGWGLLGERIEAHRPDHPSPPQALSSCPCGSRFFTFWQPSTLSGTSSSCCFWSSWTMPSSGCLTWPGTSCRGRWWPAVSA